MATTQHESAGSALDPESVRFVAALRELRRAAGAPSFAELARRTGLARSTLYDGLRGDRLPSLELTLALVRALDGDEAAWRARWIHARTTADDEPEEPAVDSVPVGTAPVRGRRLRLWLVGAVVVIVAAVIVVVLVVRQQRPACTPVREYRVTSAGAVLSADGRVIGQTAPGDVVEVRSLTHDRYAHRYLGTDRRTHVHGYLDEARLRFTRDTCA